MSHIFDALQRSETERSGAEADAVPTATELLQRAERQALSQWEAEKANGDVAESTSGEPEPTAARHALPPADVTRSHGSITEGADGAECPAIFSQFQIVESSPPVTNRLVNLTDKQSAAAEGFHLLKVRLRHRRRDMPLKSVLITSTAPEEGKSFAAANLACSLAASSKEKTLLLEGDLRKPTLQRLFGVTLGSGICEYLRGECSLPSSIYRLEGPGIWLLPAGNEQGDPLGLIQSVKLPAMFEQLAGWFDWIIIDSPPMLPLADTTVLARLADGIILVTRRGTTEKRKLQKGLDAFESNKLLGALLNSSSSAMNADYYYYGHKARP